MKRREEEGEGEGASSGGSWSRVAGISSLASHAIVKVVCYGEHRNRDDSSLELWASALASLLILLLSTLVTRSSAVASRDRVRVSPSATNDETIYIYIIFMVIINQKFQ